ncbi:ABC transporter ATP-binding protein [uncultured Martelella sp.]|uniref:ABC transporter ATP-binding protein n=1 Tax=uncultured Martelella sp. TaxID=392331 RepID=UPI0029C911F6|nr:ABC transporter ATP-binding protein [uncultured Martelella sp.]
MSQPVLEINNLKIEATSYPPGEKPRDVVLVDDISLTLEKGRVMGLIGESGAGKSTIGLSAMAYGRGGIRIASGEVKLNGVDILKAGHAMQRRLRGKTVTYVSQSAAASFNPSRKLIDQVVETSVKSGTPRRSAERDAIALFEKLGLPEPEKIGNRYPHQVSGGQLQRAMTAMALCPRPELVIFDEPTTALDVTTQIGVLAAIKEVIRDTHVAALYITHDLAVVSQVADSIMVLRHGKMVEHGDTSQIIGSPQRQYTKDLISIRQVQHAVTPSRGAPLLRVSNLAARYRGQETDTLKDINLEMTSGQTLAVVGESGSGKSTLARAITGMLPPRRGDITFDERALSPRIGQRSRDDLRELQMIYQSADTAMNPRQTVSAIIGRPLEFYHGLKGAEKRRRVEALLDETELSRGFADRYPAELSGGQKQRVCIARALAAKPRLILCDEVTSALDPLVADGILKLLLDLQKEEGVAYLFITHDLAVVRAIADKIAVMRHGEIIRYGMRDEVLSPPFDDYTDLLLASVPEMRPGWLEDVTQHHPVREGDG